MRDSGSSTIGSGWRQLLEQLELELRSLDPDAALVDPVINAEGLPRFRAQLAPGTRVEGQRILRDYERRAIAVCEVCGHEGRVYAGVVLTVRCPSCRD